MAYAFQGSCDSHLRSTGVDALAGYSQPATSGVTRCTVEGGMVSTDVLDEERLRRWVDGLDPDTGERRGRDLSSSDADLILDGTINAPKSYSIAALIDPDLAREFEALQDRLRDRIIRMWQAELNARRGAGGRIREPLHRIEVVELQHRRSRALDPHFHRHLWLNVKVQGVDGKWSNVDSRVAMKMHTLINAEGELAARTDPEWLAALARHGYTLGADGEIAELAHAVRPLSRRSTQIESNRAVLLAAWHADHPGLEPSPDELHRIDRLAWATARPNKPHALDESAWEDLIAAELDTIDPAIREPRGPVVIRPPGLAELDLALLAAQAVVEADARSACCGGRFSLFDVRAGATRAVAASGVIAARTELEPVIEGITNRALELTIDLLDNEDRPAHIKGFMAVATATLKVDLAARFDALTRVGTPAEAGMVADAAAEVLNDDVTLDEPQLHAAAAIAGTDRLVSVTGPAGAGKTTMLRVANVALAEQGHRMVVVAPTKKAASVAGREIGAAASSLHALFADYGFRWGRDQAGAETWTRLAPGDLDPATGRVWAGPRRFPLSEGDRVVVDEAGMVDLHTANALAIVVAETGAGIAMVGDHLQARPVGHSGAMACLTRRATAVVELTAVHRFRDPDYAELTLRMREPSTKDEALAVASELDRRGLIHRVQDHVGAREAMVEAYFRWSRERQRIALVTSTNEEADAINEAIQQRRLDQGDLHLYRIAVGQGEQRLLEGDIVQTRRNDRDANVENRALWRIRRIHVTGIDLASLADSADTRTISHEYAADHVHLAYASTVHGIQGETTDAATVGPGVDAAGLYVGMTRGRSHNQAIAIAPTPAAARQQIAESMLRGLPEVGIDDAIRAARTELERAALAPEGNPTGGTDRECSLDGAGRVPAATEASNAGGGADVGEELERRRNWLREVARTLVQLDARIASLNARIHARGDAHSSPGVLEEARERLRAQYEASSRDYVDQVRRRNEPTEAALRKGTHATRLPATTTSTAVAAAGRDAGLSIR